MHFDVLDCYEDFNDPDTGEMLGAIECPKVRLEITHAQEKTVGRNEMPDQANSDC